MPPVITLTTDFGARDPYVAAMKGVILSLCPSAVVVDISHEIPPGDILEGAYVLGSSSPWFPPGTIHFAVVDPGVGGARAAIAIRTGRSIFVGPDNGLLSRACARERVLEAVRIENRRFLLPEVSRTFHGRDVFAPVAAHLARGVSVAELGSPLKDWFRLPDLRPVVADDVMTGTVIRIDRFGNAVTNIPEADFRAFVGPAGYAVEVGSVTLTALSESYDAVTPGAPLAIFGSAGELEISVNSADAGEALGIRRGDVVRVIRG